MVVKQQVQLNDVFEIQRDGILIYSTQDKANENNESTLIELRKNQVTIEMFNSAFDELVLVKTKILQQDPCNLTASGYDDLKFQIEKDILIDKVDDEKLLIYELDIQNSTKST